MGKMLLLSVVQLVFGLIVACTLGLLVVLVREGLGLNKQPVEYMYEFDPAEVRRPGAWQYDHVFFDKVTEFQNDFSGR